MFIVNGNGSQMYEISLNFVKIERNSPVVLIGAMFRPCSVVEVISLEQANLLHKPTF